MICSIAGSIARPLAVAITGASGGGAPAPSLPLDTVTSAVLAFSFRQLRTGYTGSLAKLRRAHDDAEADVDSDSSGVLSLDSPVTITSGTSSATTLGEFVAGSGYSDVDSIGSGDDAFVVTMYGQVGSTNITNATAAQQPQIVSAGVVVTMGGRPAADYLASGPGAAESLTADAASNLVQPNTFFVAHQLATAGGLQVLFDGTSAGARNHIPVDGSYKLFAGSSVVSSGLATNTSARIVTALFNGASSKVWVDNTASSTLNPGAENLGTLRVGASVGNAYSISGKIAEIIVCDADESGATRTALEANQAAFYGVTLA